MAQEQTPKTLRDLLRYIAPKVELDAPLTIDLDHGDNLIPVVAIDWYRDEDTEGNVTGTGIHLVADRRDPA
jgi:hypothetical protein